ncbi:DoxX family membrane protein [Paenibacillus herberti]|uniref:Crp/Fnr family transcriptional regulator n=1 Tax=Paenibacillus herberti TaxID=1619309 RepID=A0A229NUL2_9BACL|nr:DoxX family protein [Paenibacillus herberti]OXM13576.1 Crp/Fnr family transcriptional regulator [Paenibacillus herberti]
MVAKWFRENVWVAAAILLLRLYVGWEWMTAGWGKLLDGFDATKFLQSAVAKPVADRATMEAIFPTYTWFIEHFALPNVKLINFLIPVGEFLIGLGLILGGLTLTAAFFGMMLNFLFLFAGTVSTNPWLLLIGFIIFLAGANAGRLGLDGLLKPYLTKWWNDRAGTDTGAGKTSWLGRHEARH